MNRYELAHLQNNGLLLPSEKDVSTYGFPLLKGLDLEALEDLSKKVDLCLEIANLRHPEYDIEETRAYCAELMHGRTKELRKILNVLQGKRRFEHI